MRHLVLSSNRWFSAVSDYCLQLMTHLQSRGDTVTFAGPEGSPLESRCARQGIPFEKMPLWPSKIRSQIRSWRLLSTLLESEPRGTPFCIWTFEGREHTLCALHRKVHPLLWKGRSLLRVRGQAAPARNSKVASWLYGKAIDGLVFVAEVVRQRTPLALSPDHARVQHYCVDWNMGAAVENITGRYAFAPGLPNIDFSAPVFLVLGRYDPVKGHEWILDAFSQIPCHSLSPEKPAQLVFIGKSENVRASHLHDVAQRLLGRGTANGNRYYATDSAGTKRVFIFDERLSDAYVFVRQAHFGVIPSLGSEVICRVAVEFLQAGTPVMASAVGALPEVLPPESGGVIVPPQDTDALCQALTQGLDLLLRHPREYDSLRQQSQAFGRQQYALGKLEEMVRWAIARR